MVRPRGRGAEGAPYSGYRGHRGTSAYRGGAHHPPTSHQYAESGHRGARGGRSRGFVPSSRGGPSVRPRPPTEGDRHVRFSSPGPAAPTYRPPSDRKETLIDLTKGPTSRAAEAVTSNDKVIEESKKRALGAEPKQEVSKKIKLAPAAFLPPLPTAQVAFLSEKDVSQQWLTLEQTVPLLNTLGIQLYRPPEEENMRLLAEMTERLQLGYVRGAGLPHQVYAQNVGTLHLYQHPAVPFVAEFPPTLNVPTNALPVNHPRYRHQPLPPPSNPLATPPATLTAASAQSMRAEGKLPLFPIRQGTTTPYLTTKSDMVDNRITAPFAPPQNKASEETTTLLDLYDQITATKTYRESAAKRCNQVGIGFGVYPMLKAEEEKSYHTARGERSALVGWLSQLENRANRYRVLDGRREIVLDARHHLTTFKQEDGKQNGGDCE